MSAADLASGKGHTDENFPVASHLIAAEHRPAILSFYRVARLADDVADHPSAAPAEKLARLEDIRGSLTGERASTPEAVVLREVLDERGLSADHGLDLLEAFRRDVTKLRYDDWDDLMDYCRYSAAPVGRFVLDVHGESKRTWPASDALCGALQVINHLQDCAKDYADLDRVYLPLDSLARHGARLDMLAAPKSDPALLGVIRELAERTKELLVTARPFASQIRNLRLALEVGAIQRLAEDLVSRLACRDPLADVVHHGRLEAASLALLGVGRTLTQRPFVQRRFATTR